jgi:hypothetical protein
MEAPPPSRHVPPPAAHALGNEATTVQRFQQEEDDDDYDEDNDRPSRIPLLVAAVCILLVVIGAGAYVYAERDRLLSFAATAPSQPQPQPQPEQTAATATDAAAPAAAPDASTTKRDDRLVNGTDAPPPAAPPPDANASNAPALPDDSAPAVTPTPAVEASAEPPPTAAPLETGLDNSTGQEPVGTNLVEQRAIYYFQGSAGQAGQASEGTATWAQITKDDRPAIQATLKIPNRNVTVTVTIYKNYDSTLPASHLVEVQFNGKLSDSAIQRVPALVLKQTEQARGQPLAGAAVPVTNELFWIALSNDADEVVRNIQLLREGSWFDIPILFTDQTRALITFEKGIPGDKVFETVMAGWTPS